MVFIKESPINKRFTDEQIVRILQLIWGQSKNSKKDSEPA